MSLIKSRPKFIIFVLEILTLLILVSSREIKHLWTAEKTESLPKQTYDFIVIGAGSAGAIVACRLSQAGKDVILLEAGGAQDHILTDHPGMFGASFLMSRDKFWNYTTVPQIVGQVCY